MKVFWFLVAAVLFVASFAVFGYAFEADEIFAVVGLPEFPWEVTMFLGGVGLVALSLAIPFHVLDRVD